MTEYTLFHDDCMNTLPTLADEVDMILTDPPYGTITNLNGETTWDNIIPTQPLITECENILRMGGMMLLFCQYPYTVELVTHETSILPFNYWMYWIKDTAGNSLMSKSAPVNMVEQIACYCKKYDKNNRHPLREYADKVYDYIGLTMKQIEKQMGSRRAEHFLYRSQSSQFELCTQETYNDLENIFHIRDMPGYLSYDELSEINRKFKRKFNIPPGQKQVKNILPYKKDKKQFHPTQKPIKLLEHLLKLYSDPGDTILDFTMGGGENRSSMYEYKPQFNRKRKRRKI